MPTVKITKEEMLELRLFNEQAARAQDSMNNVKGQQALLQGQLNLLQREQSTAFERMQGIYTKYKIPATAETAIKISTLEVEYNERKDTIPGKVEDPNKGAPKTLPKDPVPYTKAAKGRAKAHLQAVADAPKEDAPPEKANA